MKTDNIIAKILFFIGILLIIVGIILGFTLGSIEVSDYYSSYNKLSWPIFFLWAIGGSISGILFIGLAEIINLLSRLASLNLKTKFEVETINSKLKADKDGN